MTQKTEREKMLNNELYLATDRELETMQLATQQLLHELNYSPPNKIQEQKALILRLFGKIGANFHIRSPFYCD